jgi:hypothetical protein
MWRINYPNWKAGKKFIYCFLSLFIGEMGSQDIIGDMAEMGRSGINLIRNPHSSNKKRS